MRYMEAGEGSLFEKEKGNKATDQWSRTLAVLAQNLWSIPNILSYLLFYF